MPEDAIVETDDSVQEDADTQTEVNWEQRYKDTQAEYTRSQQALKDEQSAWEDEQRLIAKIGEKFPHLLEDEADETVEDDDSSFEDEPEYMTKAEFEAAEKARQDAETTKEAVQQFEKDFTRFVGDRELSPLGEQALRAGQYNGPEDLEKGVDAWFAYEDSLRGDTKRKARKSHVLTGGKTATGVPDYSDMKPDEITEHMVARARALEAQ